MHTVDFFLQPYWSLSICCRSLLHPPLTFIRSCANDAFVKLQFQSRIWTEAPCPASMQVLNATLMRVLRRYITILLSHSLLGTHTCSLTREILRGSSHARTRFQVPSRPYSTRVRPSGLLSFAHSTSLTSHPRPITSILSPTHPSSLIVRLFTVRVKRVLANMSYSSSRLGAKPRAP